MNRVFTIILSVFLLFACEQKKDDYRIAIVSIVEIDPIVQLRNGFKEEFSQSEFARSHQYSFKEYNAQNDAGLQNQIVDTLVTNKPDMIYVLGTPLAQALQKRLPDVLLVQGTSTDPVSAGLADSWNGSGRNYIATTDLPPIEKQVNLIKRLTPHVKKLGVIYNPGEINSVAVIKKMREFLASNQTGIEIVERPIATTAEVATATNSLIGRVDAIYLPPDNTAHAAIPVIGRIATEYKIPFYVTVESALEHGALATLSLDFHEMGKETARLALEVLNGKNPKTLPIRVSENPLITISRKSASRLNIDLSGIGKNENIIIK